MPIVSQTVDVVVGVDTHARNHVFQILAVTGQGLDAREFKTTGKSLATALNWVLRVTGGNLSILWVIEGIGTYGALLAATLIVAGHQVVEAPRMVGTKRGVGKNDFIDAHRIAATTLSLDTAQLRHPRAGDGVAGALRTLLTARGHISAERTANVNALTALVRRVDLGIDARRPLTAAQINQIAAWRTRSEPIALATARAEAIRLARRICSADEELKVSMTTITDLVNTSVGASLLEMSGVGPITAATCMVAIGPSGRIRNAAAFASLAGVSPIPASSGNTTRYRLNRGGDRRPNSALHMSVLNSGRNDPETIAYFAKRRAEGKTDREIRRCLKTYRTRRIFRTLRAAERKALNLTT